jgi:uncharacterized protein YndB with AHSA1/START domain
MQEMRFSVEIRAAKEKIWDTLWSDETFRDWAGIIDSGTHLVGELKESNEVQFISGNGYGVTSLVEKLIPGEYLVLKHKADTQDAGQNARDDQWTGGKEVYELKEEDGATTLTITFDVPTELVEAMNGSYPKALERIKILAENKDN